MKASNSFTRTGSILALVVLTACNESPSNTPPAAKPTLSAPTPTAKPAPTTNAPAATNEQIFLVKGVIKELLPERKKVKIAHEAIPNYMEAMTMTFDVKEARELDKVKVGDTVRFRMLVTESDGWIDNLMKVEGDGQPPKPATDAKPESFRQVRDVEPLKVGDMIPAYQFTNQLGQPVKLTDFKGKAVALTFLFTRCPFPTFCPRMASNFGEAQKKLKSIVNPTNWHLVTMTFDPEYDTPAVLASYARQFDYDPARWSFLTGDLVDITAITEQFGLMFWRSDPTKPAGIDHNLRTVVIDATGRVQRIIPENEWKVDELVAAIVGAAKAIEPPPPANQPTP